MQVQQIEDTTDTFAAVGGKTKEADFKISNSATFFTLISKALYTNELLAALREPICNGWDSHIKNGKTHLPLKITVNQTEVVVQDFGSGIPHDKFNSVALSYGDSTKVESADETGGFGLGFKAPFANGPTFNCDNCCDGIKKVYEMQSAEISDTGKPKAIMVVEVPTTETGITIRMPLKPGQYGEALRYVMSIVVFGGIRAEVNGTRAAYYPSEDFNEGFICWWQSGQDGGATIANDITVRYGSVIYPLPRNIIKNKGYHEVDESEVDALAVKNYKLYKQVQSYTANRAFTLLADSGSLTIMPSREELAESLQNMQAINQMLSAMRDRLLSLDYDTDINQQTLDYYAGKKAELMKEHNNNVFVVYAKMTEVARHHSEIMQKPVIGTIADFFRNRWKSMSFTTLDKEKALAALFDLDDYHPYVYEDTDQHTWYKKRYVNYGKRFRKIRKKLAKLGVIRSVMGIVEKHKRLRKFSELMQPTGYHSYNTNVITERKATGVKKAIVIGYTDSDISQLWNSLEDEDPNIAIDDIGRHYFFKVIAAEWRKCGEEIIKIFEAAGYYVVNATIVRDRIRKEQAELAAHNRALLRSAPPEPKEEKTFNAARFPDTIEEEGHLSHRKLSVTHGLSGAHYTMMVEDVPLGTAKLVHKIANSKRYDSNFVPDGYGGQGIGSILESHIKYLAHVQGVYMVNTVPRYNALIKDGAKDWVTSVYDQIITLMKEERLRKLVQTMRLWKRKEHLVSRNFAKAFVDNDKIYEKIIGKLSPYSKVETAVLLIMATAIDDWKYVSGVGTDMADKYDEVRNAISKPVPDTAKRLIDSDSPIFWFFDQDAYFDIPEKVRDIALKLL